jgi:hypothetical protein
VFKFSFDYAATDSFNKKIIELHQFQTYFWHKHHDWYTTYEINDSLVSIYTMPYIRNEYRLICTMNRYINNPNGFDNVKNLYLHTGTVTNGLSSYLRHIETLTNEFKGGGQSCQIFWILQKNSGILKFFWNLSGFWIFSGF